MKKNLKRVLVFTLLVVMEAGLLFAQNNAGLCKAILSPLTFDKLERTVRECGLRRIEDVLPLLPGDFRSRYVLVYASRSLQGASARFPRVIMFGLDAKFILAFAGDPHLAGYDLLDTIEFNDEAKKFQFRSIDFPSETNGNELRNPAVVSEVNPQLCMNCHRSDPRPNWDTYSAWPGIYGSKNDSMPARERELYSTFKNDIFMKVGRYRFFEDAEKYPDQAWYYDYYRWGRPNLQFNWLLSLMNSQANARSFKENTRLRRFRYAALAAITCPDNFSDPAVLARYIPPSITSKSPKSFQEISSEVVRSINESYRLREERQRLLLLALPISSPISDWEYHFEPKEAEYADSTSRLRFIMEAAGVSFPKDWSMEFGSKNYVFYAGPVGQVGELGLFAWKEMLDPEQDKELYQIYADAWLNRFEFGKMIFSSEPENRCRALGKKSLEALASD